MILTLKSFSQRTYLSARCIPITDKLFLDSPTCTDLIGPSTSNHQATPNTHSWFDNRTFNVNRDPTIPVRPVLTVPHVSNVLQGDETGSSPQMPVLFSENYPNVSLKSVYHVHQANTDYHRENEPDEKGDIEFGLKHVRRDSERRRRGDDLV